jgi:hypothetical protein
MKFPRIAGLVILLGMVTGGLIYAEEPTTERVFGEWEAILFDGAVVQNVRVQGDDIFIMLQPDHCGDQLSMKISMQPSSAYRKWCTGEFGTRAEYVDRPNSDFREVLGILFWKDAVFAPEASRKVRRRGGPDRCLIDTQSERRARDGDLKERVDFLAFGQPL